MTPKKLSKKYLKRAGEVTALKARLVLEISKDEKERKILEKIANCAENPLLF